VFLVDAVLSYGRLVRIFQADVAFVFFQSGVDGAASLPNVDFATLTWNLVHPEDGGDTILRNVGSYKSHTASSPRR
jgi:hypothetical protein